MKIKKIYQGELPENKILNAQSTSQTDTYSCDYINNLQSNVYSTEEIRVGTWIDGKPIYRKSFTFTSFSDLAAGLANKIDYMVKIQCMAHQTNKQWRNIPWTYRELVNTWCGGLYFDDASGNIYFQVGSDLGNIDKGLLILEYTKTTD